MSDVSQSLLALAQTFSANEQSKLDREFQKSENEAARKYQFALQQSQNDFQRQTMLLSDMLEKRRVLEQNAINLGNRLSEAGIDNPELTGDWVASYDGEIEDTDLSIDEVSRNVLHLTNLINKRQGLLSSFNQGVQVGDDLVNLDNSDDGLITTSDLKLHLANEGVTFTGDEDRNAYMQGAMSAIESVREQQEAQRQVKIDELDTELKKAQIDRVNIENSTITLDTDEQSFDESINSLLGNFRGRVRVGDSSLDVLFAQLENDPENFTENYENLQKAFESSINVQVPRGYQGYAVQANKEAVQSLMSAMTSGDNRRVANEILSLVQAAQGLPEKDLTPEQLAELGNNDAVVYFEQQAKRQILGNMFNNIETAVSMSEALLDYTQAKELATNLQINNQYNTNTEMRRQYDDITSKISNSDYFFGRYNSERFSPKEQIEDDMIHGRNVSIDISQEDIDREQRDKRIENLSSRSILTDSEKEELARIGRQKIIEERNERFKNSAEKFNEYEILGNAIGDAFTWIKDAFTLSDEEVINHFKNQ